MRRWTLGVQGVTRNRQDISLCARLYVSGHSKSYRYPYDLFLNVASEISLPSPPAIECVLHPHKSSWPQCCKANAYPASTILSHPLFPFSFSPFVFLLPFLVLLLFSSFLSSWLSLLLFEAMRYQIVKRGGFT